MATEHLLSVFKNYIHRQHMALRYWLVWAVLLAALAYGFHRYLEYRNHELDKRLKELKIH